ncbi:hypothetical protein LTR10_004136 [Elasticomyces elasticus]|nr:hypothetical protein LTR10_004136 [Elasticomyces elasticus]KAK4977680.1 hypothetical protein LTR42_002051 [Elasticomyces elasticus]
MPIQQGFLGQSSDDSNHNPDNKDDNNNNNDNNKDDNTQAQRPTSFPRVVTLGDMMREAENNMADPQRALDRDLAVARCDMENLRARITALERTVTVLERDRVERERRPRTPVRDEMPDDDARIRPAERRPAERRGMLQGLRRRAIEAGEFEDYAAVSEDERLRRYDHQRHGRRGILGRNDIPFVVSEVRQNEREAVFEGSGHRQMSEERTLVDGNGDVGEQERDEGLPQYEGYRRRALMVGEEVMSEELWNERVAVLERVRRRAINGQRLVDGDDGPPSSESDDSLPVISEETWNERLAVLELVRRGTIEVEDWLTRMSEDVGPIEGWEL